MRSGGRGKEIVIKITGMTERGAKDLKKMFQKIPVAALASAQVDGLLDKVINLSGIADIIGAPFEIIAGAMTKELSATVKQFADALLTEDNKKLFQELGTFAGQFMENGMKPLLLALKVAAPLMPLLSAGLNQLNYWIDHLQSTISAFLSGSPNELSTFFASVNQGFKNMVFNILSFFNQLPGQIAQKLKWGLVTILNFFKNLPQQIVNTLQTWFKQTFG